MVRSRTELRSGSSSSGRGVDRAGRATASPIDPHKPVAMVRDLPANFFAVGRMHDSQSFLVIDSKEIVNRKSQSP